MENKACSFCDRSGILFYPVRYAVACPAGAAGVPGLPGNFRVDGAPKDISPAKYTLRGLRSGYLYVFDEKRRRLKVFVVMPTGSLSPIDESYDPVQQPAAGAESCVSALRAVLPKCFAIEHSDSDPAGRMWLGWSNTFWTKQLRSKVTDATWRRLHMKCFDVPSLLTGAVAHAGEFSEAANSIPHFVADAKAFKAAFGFSGAPIEMETKQRLLRRHFEQVLSKSSSTGKAFAVALNDPVGMANDLSELTLPTSYSGFDETAHRGSICMNLLESLEAGVRNDARRKAEERHVIGTQPKVEMMVVRGGAIPKPERRTFHKTDAEREKAVQGEEERAWAELIADGKPLLDSARIKEFPLTYAAALKNFEPKATRLAALHCEWLQSDQLAEWMRAVHDDEDIRSGYAYRESLAQCIGHGVNTIQCKELLLAWLSADSVKDTKNLLSKALLFNQAELINATTPHLKSSDFPTEGILNLYKRAIEKVSKFEAAKLVENLVLTVASILIDAVRTATSLVVRNMVMVGLSLTGHVVICARDKTKREIWDWIMQAVRNEPLLQSRQQVRAIGFDAAKAGLRHRNESSSLGILEIDMKSIGREGTIAVENVRLVEIPGVEQVKKWLGSSVPREFRLGLVTAIIQLIALGYALKDLDDNNRFNEYETRAKAGSAALTVLTTITEAVAITAKKATTHPLSLYLLDHWKSTPARWMKIAVRARVIGALAGLTGALFDFQKAYVAKEKGRSSAAWTFAASGVVGVGLGYFSLFGTPALWPLLLVAISFAILLPYLTQAELRVWIGRCYFGVDAEKYLSTEEEVRSFNTAVGG